MNESQIKYKILGLIQEYDNKYPTLNYSIRYSNRMSRTLAAVRHSVNRLTGKAWRLEFVFNEKYIKANLDNWERIKTTVLHEIAHAIVGYQHGHDKVWVTCCKSIGGDGERLAKRETFNHWNKTGRLIG